MMGEMGMDWGSAGGFGRVVDGVARLADMLEQMAERARKTGFVLRGWPVITPAPAQPEWAGYPGMRWAYLALDRRARRQNERQMRRRRHAGRHGGIRWATYVAACRKMAPRRRWVLDQVEGK